MRNCIYCCVAHIYSVNTHIHTHTKRTYHIYPVRTFDLWFNLLCIYNSIATISVIIVDKPMNNVLESESSFYIPLHVCVCVCILVNAFEIKHIFIINCLTFVCDTHKSHVNRIKLLRKIKWTKFSAALDQWLKYIIYTFIYI